MLTEDILADPTDPDSDVIATDVPEIAMMGGSYGGGIQMTTVDPRIQAIVPSIAWNSLNQSLYPDNVFKTGWANVLAGALLLPTSPGDLPGGSNQAASGLTRVNSQITQALITGNLFGFISESGQAVLSSSGPTTLLSKLNAPVLFNQGTVDALFPLQQAVENAQTLLEQNPYLNGTIDPSSMGYRGRGPQDDLVLRRPRCLHHADRCSADRAEHRDVPGGHDLGQLTRSNICGTSRPPSLHRWDRARSGLPCS